MKLQYLFALIIVFSIATFSSCKKEETPLPQPVKCEDLSITLNNLGSSKMDSVRLVVYDANQVFDSTFINPQSGFSFTKEFCGEYSFTLDVFNTQSASGWEVNISGGDRTYDPIPVNGDTKLVFERTF